MLTGAAPPEPSASPHPVNRPRAVRPLLNAIAVATVAVFTLSGCIYLGMWDRAGEELPRLLPADVGLHVAAPAPKRQLERAMRLARWEDPEALARGVSEAGFLASTTGGDVAGLPLSLIRDRRLLRAIQSAHLAIVPTDEGQTTMLFVELPELLERRRVTAELSPLLETVARHVGFDIKAVTQSPWVRFTGADAAAPRVVVMDPWIVLAWGDVAGLDELLDARVGGRGDNLRTASLLAAVEMRVGAGSTDFRATVDAALLWRSMATGDAREHGPFAASLGPLSVATRFLPPDDGDVGEDEVVDAAARVTSDVVADRLAAGFTPSDHALLELAPTDAPFAASIATERPLRTIAAVRTLLSQANEGLGGDTLARAATALAGLELADPEVAAALAGDLLWTALPPTGPGAPSLRADPLADGWVLVARFTRPRMAEEVIGRLIGDLLGDRYAIGRVATPEGTLHLLRPSESEGLDGAHEAVAWRFVAGRLELAPRVAHLDRFAQLQRDARAYGHSDLATHARRNLPATSDVALIAHPGWLETLDAPMVRPALEQLAPTYRLAATLDFEGGWLRASSNFGPWTVIAAIAGAPRAVIDRLTLPGLDPACRQAHAAMCARYPDAVPCRPLSLGRNARIRAACEALGTSAPR